MARDHVTITTDTWGRLAGKTI